MEPETEAAIRLIPQILQEFVFLLQADLHFRGVLSDKEIAETESSAQEFIAEEIAENSSF